MRFISSSGCIPETRTHAAQNGVDGLRSRARLAHSKRQSKRLDLPGLQSVFELQKGRAPGEPKEEIGYLGAQAILQAGGP
jgi:hypothetical protein